MMNVALLGAGGHSVSCHAPALQYFARQYPDQVRLAALCDIDEAKARGAAEQFGFAHAYTSISRMFAEEQLNALVSVTPVSATLAVTRELIPYGVPLLIEKPLGNALDEAQQIADVVDDAPVMVSMNRRFDTALNRALAFAREQGPLRYVHGAQLRPGRTEPDFVWGTGIHLIDALNYVAGPLQITHVTAMPQAPGGCWRTATLRGQDDCAVTLEILPTAGSVEERIRLAGDDYCVDAWVHFAQPWRVKAYRDFELVIDECACPETPAFLDNGSYGETVAFLTAVLEGRPLPGPNIHDALHSSELASALQHQPFLIQS